MENAQNATPKIFRSLRQQMAMDSLFIADQMMEEHMKWGEGWWTTDGQCHTVHFFVDFSTAISMSSALPHLGHLNMSSNIFKRVQIMLLWKSIFKTKSNGLSMVATSLHLTPFGVYSIMNFMSRSQTLVDCKSTFPITTWSSSIPISKILILSLNVALTNEHL